MNNYLWNHISKNVLRLIGKPALICIVMLHAWITLSAQQADMDKYRWKCFLKRVTIEGTTNVSHFQFTYLVPSRDSIPEKYGKPICREDIDIDIINYEIPVLAFDGENQAMLNDFRNLLKASIYPDIGVSFERRIFREIVMKKNPELELDLTIAGVSKLVTADYQIYSRTETRIVIKGKTNFYLTDFDITPPQRVFGLVQVNNKVSISFEIILRRSLKE
jgi:hypothetical protein